MNRQEIEDRYSKAIADYLNCSNVTLKYICDKHNVYSPSLSRRLKKLGIEIKRGYNKEFRDELDAAINHYVNTGDSMETTCAIYKVDIRTLGVHLKQKGLTRRSFTQPGYQVNEQYFHNIDSEEKAYWYGFLLADGCVRLGQGHQNKSAQVTLELSNQDYRHLEKFKAALEFSGDIKSRSNRPISCVRISRMQLVNDLISLGCVPDKTHEGWVSRETIQGLEDHFVRGYCDGNGFIDKKRTRIIFTMGSQYIQQDLMYLLAKYNPTATVDSKLSGAGNPTYRVNIQSKEGFYNFLSDKYLNAQIYLDRKMLIALTRIQAHCDQLLSEDHRKIMRDLAGTAQIIQENLGESETERITK